LRWKLVANAVSVPVAEWVGRRLATPGDYDASDDEPLESSEPWPTAAWGDDGVAYRADVSTWPVRTARRRWGGRADLSRA